MPRFAAGFYTVQSGRNLRSKYDIYLKHSLAILVRINSAIIKYDQTLGYPGEGWRWQKRKTRRQKKRARRKWSKLQPNLKFTTWNCRSLTRERFNYCQSLNYDVLCLTELWRNQEKFHTVTKRWTCSATIKGKNGNLLNTGDPAAGVGILLSARMEKKVLSYGNNNCERLCWVRLQGPTCNVYVICVNMPHRARVEPCRRTC